MISIDNIETRSYIHYMFKKIAAAIIAITLVLMGAVYLFAEDVEITISESEAQASINAYLVTHKPENFGVRLSPEYVSIDFKSNNTAEVSSDMAIDGYGFSGRFDGIFATGIDYRFPRLYLDDLRLIDGGFQTDEENLSALKDLRKSAIELVERTRRSDADIDAKIGSGKNSDVFVEEMRLNAVHSFFNSIPIFDLKASDKAGMAASLAMKDVKFTEDTAILTFSPVTAILRILTALGVILLLILWILGPQVIGYLISRAMTSEKN